MVTKVIASERNWIEGKALEQLERISQLPGMLEAVGMPDLHPGTGIPIGAVFATQGVIYPHLVGNDIGCGMSLWQTQLTKGNLKFNRLEKYLKGLEGQWSGNANEFLLSENVAATQFDLSLGTIGRGNHFAEFQQVQDVFDPKYLDEIGLESKKVFLLVHSGSRGLGEKILQAHVTRYGAGGLSSGSAEAAEYLKSHEHALAWARANRKLIAIRFMEALGTKGMRVLDICHNSVSSCRLDDTECWLHRKGAAPTDKGLVVIPGSRGTLSYLVLGIGAQRDNLATVAHGAGRKWRRSDCRARLEEHFTKEKLLRTDIGSRVICDDKNLLYEEAPQAYKNVDVVVSDLVNAGFVRVIATFAPVLTYKTRSEKITK